MHNLVKAFGFSFTVHFLLYWAYFTWDLYQSNQAYLELLHIIQKELSENQGGNTVLAFWSSNTINPILWTGCLTFPLLMGAYVAYIKKFSRN